MTPGHGTPRAPTKAILLDLGNVIVGLDFDRGYRAAASRCEFSVDEIPNRIRDAALSVPYELGEISNEEFHRRFCEALEMRDVSLADFSRLWGDMFEPAPLLSDGLLRGLRERYRLVLLSNTNDLHFRWIREHYPLLEHFHEYVLSYEVASMKPSPEIYRRAIQAAGCPPEECFFTDDTEPNIEGARRLGIDAVVFAGEEHLKKELARRGVVWEPTA
jgi:putative hydrolase of the HAD superfamily